MRVTPQMARAADVARTAQSDQRNDRFESILADHMHVRHRQVCEQLLTCFRNDAGMCMIRQSCRASRGCAMDTTENRLIELHSVTQHPTPAVFASRRQGVDRAFERIEVISLIVENDAKRILVIVAASMTSCHGITLRKAH